MLKNRDVTEPRGWAFATVVGVVKPVFRAFTKCEWIDGHKIPASGGCVAVANHISHSDPLVFGLFLYDQGRLVRYLAKDEVFHTPILKTLVKGAGQIPVKRLTTDAASAFSAAVEGIGHGELIGIYPEGTLTRDPNLWPMTGKTGAARIALTTGCPVIPVAQWGPQELLAPYSSKLKLFPRKRLVAKAGDPVDLSDLSGQPMTAQVLTEATNRIMDAITEILVDLRGEPAPATRFDPRKAGVRQTGNPKKAPKGGSK